MDDRTTTLRAYGRDIAWIGELLRGGQSVLVSCDKVVTAHLWPAITEAAGRRAVVAEQVGEVRAAMEAATDADVVVLPQLDLLADRTGLSAPGTAAELVAALHGRSEPVLLGLADPGLPIPEVVADRFSMKLDLHGVPREVDDAGTRRWFTDVLLTPDEVALFPGLDPADFHRMVAGLNPVQFRRAVRFAVDRPSSTVVDLYASIRAFKAHNAPGATVPDVTFDQIGGYAAVKQELIRTVDLLTGRREIAPGLEWLHQELAPRAVLLHGPPGTGKTTIAHAIANRMNAVTILTSGPELADLDPQVTERHISDLFAQARRYAPAVVVIDELDAIAPDRTRAQSQDAPAGPDTIVSRLAVELGRTQRNADVLVVGTTNRVDLVDPALLRPSRFRAINVPLPTAADRHEIVAVYAARLGLRLPADLHALVVAGTEIGSGRDIRDILVATVLAAGNRRTTVDAPLLTEHLNAGRARRREIRESPFTDVAADTADLRFEA